jgi:CubicO group peptidase (beta-lactamase class C family)
MTPDAHEPFAETPPDLASIPRADWDRAPWNRWTFQHIAEVLATAAVRRRPGEPSPLPEVHQPIDEIGFSIDGESDTVAGFLAKSFTDGFLALHRGKVVAERYANGMTPSTLHLSQSVAKSVVGTVAGIVIARGALDPAAPLTDYLPELAATAYRGATVQQVLDMTSGVVFDETYTAVDSHMAKLDVAAGWKDPPDPSWPRTVLDLILTLAEASRPHGEAFEYRSIETDVLAMAMERATGVRLAELVAQELWQPLGAEADANFTIDPAGYALADGGFNATLRDYARFALLHLDRGTVAGRRVVPEDWLAEIVRGDAQKFGEAPRTVLPKGAYHNQFWVEDPAGSAAYMARGVFGQLVYIDPAAEFAAVKLSSWPEFTNATRTRTALAAVRAIRDALTG